MESMSTLFVKSTLEPDEPLFVEENKVWVKYLLASVLCFVVGARFSGGGVWF